MCVCLSDCVCVCVCLRARQVLDEADRLLHEDFERELDQARAARTRATARPHTHAQAHARTHTHALTRNETTDAVVNEYITR